MLTNHQEHLVDRFSLQKEVLKTHCSVPSGHQGIIILKAAVHECGDSHLNPSVIFKGSGNLFQILSHSTLPGNLKIGNCARFGRVGRVLMWALCKTSISPCFIFRQVYGRVLFRVPAGSIFANVCARDLRHFGALVVMFFATYQIWIRHSSCCDLCPPFSLSNFSRRDV